MPNFAMIGAGEFGKNHGISVVFILQ